MKRNETTISTILFVAIDGIITFLTEIINMDILMLMIKRQALDKTGDGFIF
ncbi:MAG: hypothetical protein GX383_09920 [Clostridium sp.]|nr:hypothetical protein [Clostridium sp.]